MSNRETHTMNGLKVDNNDLLCTYSWKNDKREWAAAFEIWSYLAGFHFPGR